MKKVLPIPLSSTAPTVGSKENETANKDGKEDEYRPYMIRMTEGGAKELPRDGTRAPFVRNSAMEAVKSLFVIRVIRVTCLELRS